MSGDRKTEPLYMRDGQCSTRSRIHSAYPHPLHPLHMPLVCRTARQANESESDQVLWLYLITWCEPFGLVMQQKQCQCQQTREEL